ncbi:MAG: UvrD-helicase domain-containing protein, partial [bacterium]
ILDSLIEIKPSVMKHVDQVEEEKVIEVVNEINNILSQSKGLYFDKFLENVTSSMNIGTFHSIAAKILRRHAELLGYTSGFTIINQDDQLRVTKQLIKDYNLDEKSVSPKVLLYYI